MTVLAATRWASNADLIADCASLGYLRADVPTLDPTFGLGNWWTAWRPDVLIAHDLDPAKGDGVDFRALPETDHSIGQAVFDPPYQAQGGAATSSIGDHLARYGRGHDLPAVNTKSPASVQQLIGDGLAELARVLVPQAPLLVKCADYIWSGKLWPGTHLTLTQALDLGFTLTDRLELIGEPGPQPKRGRCIHCRSAIQRRSDGRWSGLGRSGGDAYRCASSGDGHEPDPDARTQRHAARNLSTMFVLAAPTAAALRLPVDGTEPMSDTFEPFEPERRRPAMVVLVGLLDEVLA